MAGKTTKMEHSWVAVAGHADALQVGANSWSYDYGSIMHKGCGKSVTVQQCVVCNLISGTQKIAQILSVVYVLMNTCGGGICTVDYSWALTTSQERQCGSGPANSHHQHLLQYRQKRRCMTPTLCVILDSHPTFMYRLEYIASTQQTSSYPLKEQ